MLRLRCKAKNGTHLMQGLTHQSCVRELKDKIEELTGIPCDVQKIMVGYPPSSLDLRNGEAHLKDYPIKSGLNLLGRLFIKPFIHSHWLLLSFLCQSLICLLFQETR